MNVNLLKVSAFCGAFAIGSAFDPVLTDIAVWFCVLGLVSIAAAKIVGKEEME